MRTTSKSVKNTILYALYKAVIVSCFVFSPVLSQAQMARQIYPPLESKKELAKAKIENNAPDFSDKEANNSSYLLSPEQMQRMQDNVQKTHMTEAQIPPIINPVFVPLEEASLSLDLDEPVFVLDIANPVRIYPMRILLWHEVLYDSLPSKDSEGNEIFIPIFITYSPLTATLVAYKAAVDGVTLWLQSTASLLYGNAVLYDRKTESLWSQMLGVCFKGTEENKQLDRIPINWTNWKAASKKYPHAQVLSRTTGYKRDYGSDPYASFYSSSSLAGPLPRKITDKEKALPLKHLILGLAIDSSQAALDIKLVKKETVINFKLGLTSLVAMYDHDFEGIKLYFTRVDEDDPPLKFRFDGEFFRDDKTNSEWNIEGQAVRGRMRGTQLKRFFGTPSLWYAWFSYYPNTTVITHNDNK